MSSGWSGPFPPSSRPLPVEDGIRARSTRGPIGRSWWSGRFVAVLESIVVGGRLQRGRTYARKGQVIALRVEAGAVTAEVQGSRSQPYRVRIGLVAFGEPEWAAVEQALAGDAWYAAKLLAGEMPEDIEDVFAGVGLSLFPSSAGELSMDCSCPDREVPCKHLAAVFYLLAESFDEDPFRILAWRGRDREELLAEVDAARGGGPPAADLAEGGGPPLEACIESWFELQGDLPATRPPVAGSTALLGQLPPVDVEVRGRTLVELLEPAYVALGDAGPGPD